MTPQLKKQFSYSRDCRNCFGEHTRSTRKAIPRRRARKHRQYRHAVKQAVGTALDYDQMHCAVAEVRRDGWRKLGDIPLGVVVRNKRHRRIDTGQQPA